MRKDMKKKTLDYIVVVALVVAYAMGIGRDTSGEYQSSSLIAMGIIAGVSAIAKGVASLIGNRKKKKALRKLNQQYDAMIADTDDRINANFLDRADSKNAIRKVEESNKEALRQLNTDAIRRGATDEAKVAMASKLSQRTADVVGELSSIGEQYKDRLRDRKQSLQENKAAQNFQIESDTSGIDAFSSAISEVGNAAIGLAGTTSGTPTNTPELGSATANNATKNDIGGVKVAQQKVHQDASNEQMQKRYGEQEDTI
jgi:hypothetical protein